MSKASAARPTFARGAGTATWAWSIDRSERIVGRLRELRPVRFERDELGLRRELQDFFGPDSLLLVEPRSHRAPNQSVARRACFPCDGVEAFRGAIVEVEVEIHSVDITYE